MVKIVILGSCRFEPYEVLFTPKKVKGKWNTEEGYKIASKKCYKAIEEADIILVYAPDGIGEHTKRDIEYALKKGKKVIIVEVDKVYTAKKEMSKCHEKIKQNGDLE